jgi:hypothetical protein
MLATVAVSEVMYQAVTAAAAIVTAVHAGQGVYAHVVEELRDAMLAAVAVS